MNTKVKMLLMTFLFTVLTQESQSDKLYISLVNGVDEMICGSYERMCKTIAYAVEMISADNDTLYIDGGDNTSLVYKVNQTINVSKTIHIKHFNKLKPVISQNSEVNAPAYAFNISQARQFTLNSIHFISINILFVESTTNATNYAVAIVNCTTTNLKETYPTIHIDVKSDFNLSINRCNFYQPNILRFKVEKSAIDAYCQNSLIFGLMEFSCGNCYNGKSTITLENITATKESNFQFIGDFHTIYISNSTVENITKPNHKNAIVNFQSEESFSTTFLTIEECDFVNNILENDLIKISKSTLNMISSNINNVVALYILRGNSNSKINITLCNINKNRAVEGVMKVASNNHIHIDRCNLNNNNVVVYLRAGSENNINLTSSSLDNNAIETSIISIKSRNNIAISSTSICSNIVRSSTWSYIILNAYTRNTVGIVYSNISNNSGIENVLLGDFKNNLNVISCNMSNNTVGKSMLTAQAKNTLNITSCILRGNIIQQYVIDLQMKYTFYKTNNAFISSCLIWKNSVKLGFLRSLSSDSIIAIKYCVIEKNIISSTMFDILGKEVTFISSTITHTRSYDSNEMIKFKGSKESNFVIKGLNVTWNPINASISIAPIIKVNTKTLKVEKLLLHITAAFQKVNVFYISVDTISYTDDGADILKAHIQCPQYFYPVNINRTYHEIELFCIPCETNKYNIIGGQCDIMWKSISVTANGFDVVSKNLTKKVLLQTKIANLSACFQCPVGGVCKNSIKSSGNFYGYKTNNLIKFLPCFPGYCCSYENKRCKTFNTCNYNRRGILCGTCNKNYFESYFSTACISKKQCKNQKLFWLIYSFYVITISTLLLFLNDIKNIFKRFGIALKHAFSTFPTCNKNTSDTEQQQQEQQQQEQQQQQQQLSLSEIRVTRRVKSIDQEGTSVTIYPKHSMIADSQKQSYTLSGIITLLASFYQIKSVLTVNIGSTYENPNEFHLFVLKIFNLDVTSYRLPSYCPTENLDAITKLFVRNILFTLTVFFFIGATIFIKMVLSLVVNICGQKRSYSRDHVIKSSLNLTFLDKVGVFYLRILLLSYKNIAVFFIVLLHCERITEHKHLYIMGNIICYHWWQIFPAAVVVPWLLVFPMVLSFSFYLYRDMHISFTDMLISVTFPMYLPVLWRRRRIAKTNYLIQDSCLDEVTKLFEEPYKTKQNVDKLWFLWESWKLYERLILAIVSNIIIQPILRVCILSSLILLFQMIYWKVKPYKQSMVVLHWMNVVSMISYSFLLILNMFAAVLYVYDIPNSAHIQIILQVFRLSEYFFSPLSVIVMFSIVKPMFKFIGSWCRGKLD